MADWHGYVKVKIETLGDANWVALITLIREIQTNGRRSAYRLVERGNLNTFVDANNDLWSYEYIYEANYAENAVSFAKFAQKLANAFGKPVEDVSYTTALDAQGNVEATYQYNAVDRFTLTLFGCPDDANLCTWEESADAADAHITANSSLWNLTNV